MSDADDRFVEKLSAVLASLVGPRLRIVAIDTESMAAGRVRMTVTLETTAKPYLMIQEGDSLTAVAASLLAQAPEVRLAEGFREVLDGVSHVTRADLSRQARRVGRLSSSPWIRCPEPMSSTSRTSPALG